MAEPAHGAEDLGRPVALAAGVQGEDQLAGLGHGHPGLVADAADAEAGHDEGVPARREQLGAVAVAQRAAEHGVVPVHREPALVGERLPMTGEHVTEQVGRELPVGLRLAGQIGQRERAAQPMEDARAPGQQRELARPAGRVALPGHLAARRLQLEHPADRGPDGRPHPEGEAAVAGDEELMPDADREVGGVMTLGRVVGHLVRAGRPRPARRPRPRAVRALRVAQPLIRPSGPTGQPAGGQGHRALHVVPRVHVAVRPGDGAARPLGGGD